MASAALGACTQGPSAGDEVGSETGESETGAETGESETGAETGESETGETGESDGGTTGVAVEELVSDENAPACQLVPGDHAEACASLESCPIVDDVELRCDDAALGDYGLSVAVDGEAVHVAVSGSSAAWLLATSGSQGEAIALPEHYATHHIELAQSLDGRRFVANMRSAGEHSDIVVTEVGASSFVAEQLVDAGGHVHELDFDYEGRAHVWFDAKPLAFGSLPHQLGTRHAERIGDASWWQADAREWATTYVDFALSQGGSPVMASLEPESEWFQLYGTLLGHELALYDGHVALRTPLLAELPKPDPLPFEVEPYVVIVGDEDRLTVVWPDIDGWQALPMPGTAPEQSECVFQCPCPSDCHDVGEGVPSLGYAIARMSDASVWFSTPSTRTTRSTAPASRRPCRTSARRPCTWPASTATRAS